MKKQLLWLLFAAPIGVWAQNQPFSISGQFKNYKTEAKKLMLVYAVGGKRVIDSVNIVDGKYFFKGTIAEPVYAGIWELNSNTTPRSESFDVFLEPGNITVTHDGSFSNVRITGDANAAFTQLKKKLAPQKQALDSMMKANQKAWKSSSKKSKEDMGAKIESLNFRMKETYFAYFNENPSSPVAMYALQQSLPSDINAHTLEALYNRLNPNAKLSEGGKALKMQLDVITMTGINKTAPDFTQNDTLNKPVKLSSFKGKYVLIDFWASWCGPCRAENPNVVKAYNAYKDKGFTVLGVSLDNADGKNNWLKAIHDDGLSWTQVSDLHGWSNAAAKLYGIHSIPQNFLLNPEGKIIAKNLRGKALEKKLAELFL